MSVIFLSLLLFAVTAVALGSAALLAARGLRRQLAALREDLLRAGAQVPAARTVPTEEIRTAVADALADERERELAEARAFWAEQEAGDATSAAFFHVGPDVETGPTVPYLPRQADLAGIESDLSIPVPPGVLPHPSAADFSPSPVVADQNETAERLSDLADGRIPLSDVRSGPLGTLDVYVFADGTSLCMTPGDRATAAQLSEALEHGEVPYLVGGSAIGGAYALTFALGDESVYILADRVVASL